MWLHNYLELEKNPVWLFLHADKTNGFKKVSHAHQGIEMLYIHEGRGTVVLEQRSYQVSSGTLLLFKPFQPHQVSMITNDSFSYIRSLFVFDPILLDQHLVGFRQLRLFFHEIWKGDCMRIVSIPHPEEMDNFLIRGKMLFPSPTIYQDLEQRLLFLIQFLEYIRPLVRYNKMPKLGEDSSGPVETDSVERIIQWLELHYAEPIILEQLAKVAHLSPNYLSTLFHKKTGIRISDFILQKRLQQACLMLEASTFSVKEIGTRTGYPNPPYFCKLFKQHLGVSPQVYRDTARKLLANC